MEHVCDGVPKEVWDYPLATPYSTPSDLLNFPNRQTELMIEEKNIKQRRAMEKAHFAQQVELVRPRLVADDCAALYGDCDGAQGERSRLILDYQYLLPYDEYEVMEYVEPVDT